MPKLDDMRCLMVCRTMGIGGTEKVVLQLCQMLVGKTKYLAVASCGGVNTEVLDTLGIQHHYIPDIADKSPAHVVSIIRSLRKIVREDSINVVHCHHRMAAFYAQCALNDTTCVATAHSVFHDKKKLTRYAYHGIRVAACGRLVEKNLLEFYGLDAGNIDCIQNSVKPFHDDIMPIEEIKRCPKDVLKIGFLGRLSEAKGVCYLIDAIAILTRRHIPEPERIVFMGRRADPQNFLAQIDVCAMPSLWEGLPLVLLEAFSVGTAVAASAADGILDVVENGVDGLLSSPGDATKLADSIESLYKSPFLRETIGRAAKHKFEREYSYEIWTSKYEKFYQEVLR